jgi:hypothetical protein
MLPQMPNPEGFCVSTDLIRACIDKADAASWGQFVRLTHDAVAAAVIRRARRFGESSPAILAELVQEIYLRVCDNHCRVLCEFRADRPEAIYGLLKIIAFTVTEDHFRSKPAPKPGVERPVGGCGDQLGTLGGREAEIAPEVELTRDEPAFGRGARRTAPLAPRSTSIIGGERRIESIHRLAQRVKDWLARFKQPDERKKLSKLVLRSERSKTQELG